MKKTVAVLFVAVAALTFSAPTASADGWPGTSSTAK